MPYRNIVFTFIFLILTNLSPASVELNHFDVAELYTDTSGVPASKLGADSAMADLFYFEAVDRREAGNHLKAARGFKNAATSYLKIGDMKLHNRCLELAAIEYRAAGRTDSAIVYQQLLIAYKDTLNQINKQTALNAIKAKTRSEMMADKLKVRQKLNQAHIRQLYMVFAGLIVILATVFGSIYYIRRKNYQLAAINIKIAESHDFRKFIYNKLVNDVRQSLFPLAISIARLAGSDEYEKLNSHYMNFAEEFNTLLKDYEQNSPKE